MVDKLFGKVFTAMDNSKTVQEVTKLLGVQEQTSQQQQPVDKTLCIIHKLKKTFFCEQCLFELCYTCRDKHEMGHPIKFVEETAKLVIDRFQNSLEEMNKFRKSLNEAANDDPTKYPVPEGQMDVIDLGNKEIDHIFEKIYNQLEQAKTEMKQRLKEAYILHYKSNLDSKSQSFINNLDKLEKYVLGCLEDFDKRMKKGKLAIVCAQRPKVDDLYKNLDKFNNALKKLTESSREFKAEYSLSFKAENFEEHLRELIDAHTQVTFPHLENGFFMAAKKPTSFQKVQSLKEEKKSQVPFDPIKSLENEQYDIRRAKDFQKQVQEEEQLQKVKSVVPIGDQRFEIKTLRFRKDKFEVKTYDSQNRVGSIKNIMLPDEIKRIATRHFSYVSVGRNIIMSGGQFIEDKTCSMDCFKIKVYDENIKELKGYLKVPRMQHSMIYIDEKKSILAVGGEDENGNLLDSCELWCKPEKQWKVLNTLNCKGKNLSLCKFTREFKKDGEKTIYIYAFGREAVERIEFTKIPISPKWEEVNVKNWQPLNAMAAAFKFDDQLILICGGVDDKNSPTQDIFYFNPINKVLERSQVQLGLCDKFIGGSMTQFTVNKIESKIFFCSESFAHELEYGVKAGDQRFKCRANLY